MRSNAGLVLLGILAWAAVAAVALVAVNWDDFLGFFVTLAAVVLAWVIGEFVTRRAPAPASEA